MSEGKPMLVVVGADWCPACQTLKNGTLAQMERQGKLREVSYVSLNSDRHPDLASRLGSGSTIPQVILYEKSETGFRRRQLTGAQGEGVIASLVKGAAERRSALSGKLFRQASN
jgi:thioredoxin-like negative regulator of GroEL